MGIEHLIKSMTQDAIKKIDQIRIEIDKMDTELVNLLNKRAELAFKIKQLKIANNMPILDSGREEKIHQTIKENSQGLLKQADLERIYKLLLEIMRGIDES